MIQFVPNPVGLGELVRSIGVEQDLTARAERVRDAALNDPTWDRMVQHIPGDVPMPYVVRVSHGRVRTTVRVVGAHPAGLAVEAKHRVLGRAIDHAQ